MSPNPIYFEVVRASGGYRSHVKSSGNHQLIWWTEVYEQKVDALHAINLLRMHAASAPVKDRTAAAAA
jgi:uncharacterized protein YegP (UPF0339 family)